MPKNAQPLVLYFKLGQIIVFIVQTLVKKAVKNIVLLKLTVY